MTFVLSSEMTFINEVFGTQSLKVREKSKFFLSKHFCNLLRHLFEIIVFVKSQMAQVKFQK